MKTNKFEYTQIGRIIILFSIFFFFTSKEYYMAINATTPVLIATDPTEEISDELTVKNVRKALINEEVQHAEIVLRQAILETGWFKCTSCSLNKNNIFGFWYKKKYIEFENWKECIAYYKRWQDKHYKGGDYYTFLRKVGFATSQTYVQKLKSIKGI